MLSPFPRNFPPHTPNENWEAVCTNLGMFVNIWSTAASADLLCSAIGGRRSTMFDLLSTIGCWSKPPILLHTYIVTCLPHWILDSRLYSENRLCLLTGLLSLHAFHRSAHSAGPTLMENVFPLKRNVFQAESTIYYRLEPDGRKSSALYQNPRSTHFFVFS